MVAASQGDLTNSSGGTGAATMKVIALGVAVDLEGLTTGATAATVDLSLDSLLNAYAVLLERANDAVRTPLGMGALDETVGTIATPGTVAVIDVDVATNADDTDCASYHSVQSGFRDILSAQNYVLKSINEAREAVGLAAIAWVAPGNSQGTPPDDETFALVFLTGTTAISNAANVDPPVSSILEATIETALTALQDNVDLFADSLDAATGVAQSALGVHAA